MNQDWRCERCGALLGVEREPKLHVRYKQLNLMVHGNDYTVTTVCPKCSWQNQHQRRLEPSEAVSARG